jgi:hypothetical protein
MSLGDSALLTKDSNASRDALAGIAVRHRFVKSAGTLEQFVREWERGTLPKARWTHGAHVAVAAYFAHEHSPAALLHIMRLGIRHYNLSSGTANTESSGYHETLTRFWAGVVGEFVREGQFASRLDAVRQALARFAQSSDYFRRFYSFDVVSDRYARREWVAPDRGGPRGGARDLAL